jgi:regulator of replication initiation timing
MADADPRVIKLVRELDVARRELSAEKKRNGALRLQNDKLRRFVVALRQQQRTVQENTAA